MPQLTISKMLKSLRNGGELQSISVTNCRLIGLFLFSITLSCSTGTTKKSSVASNSPKYPPQQHKMILPCIFEKFTNDDESGTKFSFVIDGGGAGYNNMLWIEVNGHGIYASQSGSYIFGYSGTANVTIEAIETARIKWGDDYQTIEFFCPSRDLEKEGL